MPVVTPHRLLLEHLRADSPAREASMARLMAIGCACSLPFNVWHALLHGWRYAIWVSVLIVVVMTYNLVLYRALKRGWYHPAVAWANVLVEVSIPFPVMIIDVLEGGPQGALLSPVHLVWGALIVLSALRTNPILSVVSGTVAALEHMAVYLLMVLPRLPQEGGPPMVSAPAMLIRAVLLFVCGVGGANIASFFIRKAEDALRAVRERDLMGKYLLHEQLGEGGMAEVFRATYCPEGGFEKPVAIKRVLPAYSADKGFVDMFREEARLCALLNHPNIVQVFDCGTFQKSFILAMEYVDGTSLFKLVRREELLPISAVTYLGAELGAALDYIHKRVAPDGRPLHLVHRDVNPPNILLSRIGEVKLADFGVAHAANRVRASRPGVFFGKAAYAAPEQLRMERSDHRVDLFALGLTLHEALTGKRVFRPDAEATLREGRMPHVSPPSAFRSGVPAELDALVMQLIEHEPGKRPESGAEVRVRLCALRGNAAPYPAGQEALSRTVEAVVPTNPGSSKELAVAVKPEGTATLIATAEAPVPERRWLPWRR